MTRGQLSLKVSLSKQNRNKNPVSLGGLVVDLVHQDSPDKSVLW